MIKAIREALICLFGRNKRRQQSSLKGGSYRPSRFITSPNFRRSSSNAKVLKRVDTHDSYTYDESRECTISSNKFNSIQLIADPACFINRAGHVLGYNAKFDEIIPIQQSAIPGGPVPIFSVIESADREEFCSTMHSAFAISSGIVRHCAVMCTTQVREQHGNYSLERCEWVLSGDGMSDLVLVVIRYSTYRHTVGFYSLTSILLL